MEGLKIEMYALYFAYRHPKTPWYAKALAVFIVAYFLSPIDLIPDFIPVIGQLDDLIIVPAGVAVLRKLMPEEVMYECRRKARENLDTLFLSKNWAAGLVIISLWLALTVLAGIFLYKLYKRLS